MFCHHVFDVIEAIFYNVVEPCAVEMSLYSHVLYKASCSNSECEKKASYQRHVML